jgi:hypothetical protein
MPCPRAGAVRPRHGRAVGCDSACRHGPHVTDGTLIARTAEPHDLHSFCSGGASRPYAGCAGLFNDRRRPRTAASRQRAQGREPSSRLLLPSGSSVVEGSAPSRRALARVPAGFLRFLGAELLQSGFMPTERRRLEDVFQNGGPERHRQDACRLQDLRGVGLGRRDGLLADQLLRSRRGDEDRGLSLGSSLRIDAGSAGC